MISIQTVASDKSEAKRSPRGTWGRANPSSVDATIYGGCEMPQDDMSGPVASVQGKLPVEAGKCVRIEGHAGCTSVGIFRTDYRVERLNDLLR